MPSIFLSYARSDDEVFVHRLHADLTKAGFDVWFDRISMPSRQLTFHQEIRDAIAARDRLLLVVGPGVLTSDYVKQEWCFAYFEAGKCVNPIVRLDGRKDRGRYADGATSGDQVIDGYELLPEDLKLLHAEDFRDDAHYDAHLANLIQQLSEAIPPVGKLVAVPELPPSFIAQPDRIKALRDLLLVDLQKPVVVSGGAARVGLQGMGGIGKSVLASALAHRPEVRRAFPDGIYWITLGQKPQLAEQQRWLARELGDEALFLDEHSGKECLRNLLAGRKALLVLDNVWQRGHAEAFNVIGAMGRILLTTRDAGLVTALASRETHYRVELPTEAEAETIFAATTRPKPGGPPVAISPAEIREIVAECGRLPLALALCGGMVKKGVAPQAVLEALRRHALKSISDRWAPEEQHRNIWVAMEVSLEVLPPEDQERFVELAVFGIDRGAPQAAVDTLWQHTGRLGPFESQMLLSELAERSLVTLSPVKESEGQTGARMTLHDLLHNFAEGKAEERFGLLGVLRHCFLDAYRGRKVRDLLRRIARGMEERQFGARKALHQTLLDAYRKRCSSGWSSGPDDGYFFQNLCEHLLAAGMLYDAVELLTGLPWMEAKCRAKLHNSLLADYRKTIVTLSDKHGGQQMEHGSARCGELRLIQSTLLLSLYIVEKSPSQLASQMRGRLLAHQAKPGVTAFLMNLNASAPRPKLRPLWPSLEAAGGPAVRVLDGHTAGVLTVALSADGTRAVSGARDKTVRVWDLEGNQPPRVLEGHTNEVCAIALSADGKRAVSGSLDKTLRVWDLEGNEPPWVLHCHPDRVWGVALSGDGKRAVSRSSGSALQVWDLETNQPPRVLEGDSGWVSDVALSANGKRAVSGSLEDILQYWDFAGDRSSRVQVSHMDSVWAVARPSAGKDAEFGSYGGILRVWELEGNRPSRVLVDHMGSVVAVALSADGQRAVSCSDDKTMRVWDLEGNQPPRVLEGDANRVSAVAMSADGKRAMSGSDDKTLRVWDLEGNQPPRALEGHTSYVSAVALSADGKSAVSGSEDQTVRVWDLEDNRTSIVPVCHMDSVKAIALSADGKRAVSGSWDKTLRVWDLEGNQPPRVLEGHTGRIYAVALSADGKRAVSGSDDKTLRVWDLEGNRPPRILEGHKCGFNAVALSADGKRAVSGFGSLSPPSGDNILRVWDLEGNRPPRLLEGHTFWVGAVALSADGKRAVSGSWDKTLRVWDLEGNHPPRVLERHASCFNSVALSADGKLAVSGSWDSTLQVWDLEGNQPPRVLEGHTGGVTAVALSADARRVVSSSGDHTLRVWDMESGTCLAVYTCDTPVLSCAWARKWIMAGDASGHVHLFAWEE
jgi:WD40 repeat protein